MAARYDDGNGSRSSNNVAFEASDVHSGYSRVRHQGVDTNAHEEHAVQCSYCIECLTFRIAAHNGNNVVFNIHAFYDNHNSNKKNLMAMQIEPTLRGGCVCCVAGRHREKEREYFMLWNGNKTEMANMLAVNTPNCIRGDTVGANYLRVARSSFCCSDCFANLSIAPTPTPHTFSVGDVVAWCSFC